MSETVKIYINRKPVVIDRESHPVLSRISSTGGILRDRDLLRYLEEDGFFPNPEKAPATASMQVDRKKLLRDLKYILAGIPLPQASLYPSYDEYVAEMRLLEERFRGKARVVEIGRTPEGRVLCALKISRDVHQEETEKPAILFTGLVHAREWASGLVTLQTAKNLLDGDGRDSEMSRRLDRAVFWFIPVANPDGYEYSRTTDPWWRKNRAVIRGSPGPHGMGVDLNRNFRSRNKALYTISGSGSGDLNAGSDNPAWSTYRGLEDPEPEVRALQEFISRQTGLKGILDHHSYGNLILYPWGYKKDPVDNLRDYQEVAARLQEAGGGKFIPLQASHLYPSTGSSADFAQDLGITSLTVEMGKRFHLDQRELDRLLIQIPAMDLAFADWILQKAKD